MSDPPAGDERADLSFDPREVDQEYTSFPDFSEWAKLSVDSRRWDRYRNKIGEKSDVSDELLARAREVVSRAAAIDTGAIEDLYETDRGFTFTVAMETAAWEAVYSERDRKTRDLIESQLDAYDYVLDFATEKRQVREAWLRQLHEEICKSQETYRVYTSQGPQERPLPLGEYKSEPNHVRTADGSVHAYAPVEATPEEMHRLCSQLQSSTFEQAHPVLQASFAHYVLVAIHPFADGNGRVARALASVYTYRAAKIPLLILSEHQREYFSTLRSADEGKCQPFVNFVLERCLDAMQLVYESLKTAKAPKPEEALEELDALYVTQGGYTHGQVDEAAYDFYQLIRAKLNEREEQYKDNRDNITFRIGSSKSKYQTDDPGYRPPLKNVGRILTIKLNSSAPASAGVQRSFQLEVPRDAGIEDDIRLVEPTRGDSFAARVEEMVPTVSGPLEMRIEMWLDRVLGIMIQELSEKARGKMQDGGYLSG